MRLKRWIGLLAALCLMISALPGGTALAAARYYIGVDITNQVVTVYDATDGSDSSIVCRMICSTGRSGTATPTGTYTLPGKTYATERTEWYYFPKYNCYAKWATRIVGGILFHSVLYTGAKVGPTRSSVSALGSRASHGCVRLRVNDARWIALNCPAGTRCRIYYSGKTDNDLRRRLLDHSFYRSQESYDEFLGREETGFRILSRGMGGEKVRQLQARLRALGFLNDAVDGKFGANTEGAVKYFQKACGVKKTGKVNEALWDAMFADDAPTGTYVTLAIGESGAAVAALQRGLKDLRLYDGPADGDYDADVALAVSDFQGYYDYTVDGRASQALQKDVFARAKKLKKRFGDGDYRLEIMTESTEMGRVSGISSVSLRIEALSSAQALAKLKKGAEVEIVATGKRWTTARYGALTGFIKTKYLALFTRTRTTLTYLGADEPTPTPTPEISLPTPTPTPTPEISLPTPTPTPTPQISLPTPTPTPTPQIGLPTPTPAPEGGEPTPEIIQAAMAETLVTEVEAELGAPQTEGNTGEGALEMGGEPTPEPAGQRPQALQVEQE